ncbi:MAG: AIR synthase-related protein [archaeon]
MAHRLSVMFKPEFTDSKGDYVKKRVRDYFGIALDSVQKIDLFLIDAVLSDEQLEKVKNEVFTDQITQTSSYDSLAEDLDYIVEVGYLPGVKDNTGDVAARAIEDVLKFKLKGGEHVYTAAQYLLKGKITKKQAEQIAGELLGNDMIERWSIFSKSEFKPEFKIPKVELKHEPEVKELELGNDKELLKLSESRSLALSLADMHVVKSYYEKPEVQEARKKAGLSEKPTDVELEMIGQTQSEHCKHRIFNGLINYEGWQIDSLFDTYIKKSAEEIRKKVPWIVSMFWDNAGVAKFNDAWNYVVKCETHNSPSAMDPYGGALTGIVGVYRDPMGTGLGSKIIAGMYGYCTGSPFYTGDLKPKMPPRRLLEGIIEGVKDGGNNSGIPTSFGLTFFDNSYIGKPLVYVTALGMMPKEVNGAPAHEKSIDNGDLIIILGGRVGKDGIHGVTESSLELSEKITAGHVQIGDPYTQKKVHDFLLEARDKGMYNCITDCGGGGLSSAIGETARYSNGCEVHLDKVKSKYAGLAPWEIWISESQERMIIATKPGKLRELEALAKVHDVEMAVVGEYKSTGKLHLLYDGKTAAYLDMEFLHSGFPRLELEAEFNPKSEAEPKIKVKDHNETLLKMLARENIASKEFIQRQYDHEVQAGSALKMFIGAENDARGDAAVVKPLLDSNEGLATASAINPRYSKIDAYHMTACVLDEAIRRVIAVGGSLEQIALNDNFCWPNSIYDKKHNPDGKHKLAQLVRANKALYDYTTHFNTPCISGKDSMFVDGNIEDSKGKMHKVSGLPALHFTAIAKVEDVEKCVSMDAKSQGDLVYVIGGTRDELGASEFYEMHNKVGKNVPTLDKEIALDTYKAVSSAISNSLIQSCHGVYLGGLAVSLAEVAFGGGLGLEIDLAKVPADMDDETRILYSESPGRFVVTINPEKKAEFEKLMEGIPFAEVGVVTKEPILKITQGGNELINKSIAELKGAWQSTFGGF